VGLALGMLTRQFRAAILRFLLVDATTVAPRPNCINLSTQQIDKLMQFELLAFPACRGSAGS
jgi:hypothetical protein